MPAEIYTIGHSTQPAEDLVRNLLCHGVTAVADVRSAPYSRRNPQFNRDALRDTLAADGIRYVFLGKELGARRDEECCYVDGKARYDRIAKTDLFRSGMARIIEGAETYRIALLCAEKDPLDCHRTILVARELVEAGHEIRHILIDGTVETHDAAMDRLMKRLRIDGGDLFVGREGAVAQACDRQAEKIAYDRNAHQRRRR